MKIIINSSFFFFLLLVIGCSPDESGPSVEEVKQNIKVGISNPLKDRDFSFHNNGVHGVYEIPSDQKTLKGKIKVSEKLGVSSNDFTVKWTSSIDGVLFVGQPDGNFESAHTTSLSKGLHIIFFEVYLKNNPELIQKDSITISNIIKLEATPQLGRVMRLNWTKYEGNDFVSYLVYHNNYQPIAEISDINTLQYDYPEAYTLFEEHPYQIVVKTSNFNEAAGSNIVSKITGDFLKIPYFIKKMVKDPIRHKLYAICTPNDLDEVVDKYGVIIINTDTFTIENHILPTKRFTDVSVAPDGQYMYLTQRHVDVITKVNLNTYSFTNIITHSYATGFDDIEAGNNNLLYANVYYNYGKFQMINALNGSYTEAFNSFDHNAMRYNSSNDNLYLGHGSSGGHLYKLNSSNIATGTYISLPQYPIYPYDVTYPLSNVTVSDDGNHIFWDEYQLDANLNLIRNFDEIYIHACSPSNQYLSDLNKIYDFNTMNTILVYPSFGNYEFYDTDIYFTDENTILTNKSFDPNDGTSSYSYIFRIKIN